MTDTRGEGNGTFQAGTSSFRRSLLLGSTFDPLFLFLLFSIDSASAPPHSVDDIWCIFDPGGGERGKEEGWISETVLTRSAPLPRQQRRQQQQHDGNHYINAPAASSSVIKIVEAVLSSAGFFPLIKLCQRAPPPTQPFNFSNGGQPESLHDASKPHCEPKLGGLKLDLEECLQMCF